MRRPRTFKEKSLHAATGRLRTNKRAHFLFLSGSNVPNSSEEIKRRVNPSAYYSGVLQRFEPRRDNGWNVTGLCPFHQDSNPGSLAINLDSGAFKCFACGAAGGDIITFHMMLHEMSFQDALADLGRARR